MSLLAKVTTKAPSLPSRVYLYAAEKWGKCLAKGTPVLLFDGTTKPVELVRDGELLMGPDSTPRVVTGLHSNQGQLYRVSQSDGTYYDVNGKHILSLRKDRSDGTVGNEITNVAVAEFLSWSEKEQRKYRGYRVGVDFSGASELPIPAYLFGCWLGDGTRTKPEITTPDEVVVAAMASYASDHGMKIVHAADAGQAATYRITHGRTGGRKANDFSDALHLLDVVNEKSIPHVYLTSSRADRLELLAGIMDADGSLEGRALTLTMSSERLIRDTQFLARSLGFRAIVTPREKTCTNSVGKPRRIYWHLHVSGDISLLPCRVERRKDMSPRRFHKDVRTCRIQVEPIGEGQYYGFEVDKDHLFLLGDFTVTHNTSFSCYAPDPIFVMTEGETGLLTLLQAGLVPDTAHFPEDCRSWIDLTNNVTAVLKEDHKYKTLVLDTSNGAERLLTQHVCDTQFDGQTTGKEGYNSYGKGDLAAIPHWMKFLRLLDDIRVQRRMSIILLAHSKIKAVNNPEGADYDQLRPEGVDKLYGLTHKWADVIVAGTFALTIKDDKVKSGGERLLRTSGSSAVVAGNRYGLPATIPCGTTAKSAFTAFATALGKAKAAGKPPTDGGNGGTKTEAPKPAPTQPTPATPATPQTNSPPASAFDATYGEPPVAPAPVAPPVDEDAEYNRRMAEESNEAPAAQKQKLPSAMVMTILNAAHDVSLDWPSLRALMPTIIKRSLSHDAHVAELDFPEAEMVLAWLRNEYAAQLAKKRKTTPREKAMA